MLAVLSLVLLPQSQLFVQAESADHIGVYLVGHNFFEVNQARILLLLFLVVLLVALFEQVQVLVGVADDDVVAIE